MLYLVFGQAEKPQVVTLKALKVVYEPIPNPNLNHSNYLQIKNKCKNVLSGHVIKHQPLPILFNNQEMTKIKLYVL